MGLFSSNKPTDTSSSTSSTTHSSTNPSSTGVSSSSTRDSTSVPHNGVSSTSRTTEQLDSRTGNNGLAHSSHIGNHLSNQSNTVGDGSRQMTTASTSGRDGQFNVEGVETVQAAPVTQETIINHRKEETAEAVDREKHVHHHQHRVQPVRAEERLATEHETNVVPEITREQRHEMPAEHEARMHEMHNQHTDTRTIGETERTATNLGASVNEHTHHHVHEHVQPVIQKETHANKVIHTVIPIKEKIEEAPIVHETTTLPTVSLDQFQSQQTGVNSRSNVEGSRGINNAGLERDTQHAHHSQTANEVDPRVNAGRTQGTNGGYSTSSSRTGTDNLVGEKHSHHSHHGGAVHNSHLANEADPRVDADRYSTSTSTSSNGQYANTTAGSNGQYTNNPSTGSGLTGEKHSHHSSHTGTGVEPVHRHQTANEIDPRVDSSTTSNTTNAAESSVRR